MKRYDIFEYIIVYVYKYNVFDGSLSRFKTYVWLVWIRLELTRFGRFWCHCWTWPTWKVWSGQATSNGCWKKNLHVTISQYTIIHTLNTSVSCPMTLRKVGSMIFIDIHEVYNHIWRKINGYKPISPCPLVFPLCAFSAHGTVRRTSSRPAFRGYQSPPTKWAARSQWLGSPP